MKKLLITLCTGLILALGVTSCGGSKTETVQAPAGSMNLDLSKYGKPFSIFVPDSTFGKLEVIEQSWGALEIKVGKIFQISITEDAGDIELKKSDLKGDEVNKLKNYIVEEPTTIMWESGITTPEFHFYSIQKLGNSTYVFEDIKSTEIESFSKEAIQKMLDSTKNLNEIKKEHA